MKVFKYLSTVGAECFFKDMSIRFTQPGAFNDPFELQPEFYSSRPAEDNEQEIRFGFSITMNGGQHEKYRLKPSNLELFPHRIDAKAIVDAINQKVGFCCLSKADTILPSNMLMWAHYAESHQGIAIEFESVDTDIMDHALEVNYGRMQVLSATPSMH